MKFEQFIVEQRQALDRFKEFYLKGMDENPAHFPADQDETGWRISLANFLRG